MSQISTYAQTYLTDFHRYQEEYFQRLQTLVNIDSGTGQIEGVMGKRRSRPKARGVILMPVG
jgi:hypothetical protein